MSLFGWNDYVKVDPEAPEKYRPGIQGFIIGFEPWISDDGLELWTIEPDGLSNKDLQVPKKYIRLLRKADPKIERYTSK